MKTILEFKKWRDYDFLNVDRYVYDTILQAVSEAAGKDNDKYREMVKVAIAAYKYGEGTCTMNAGDEGILILKRSLTKKATNVWHTNEPKPDSHILAITVGDGAVVYYVYRNHWDELKKDVVKWCYIDDLLALE